MESNNILLIAISSTVISLIWIILLYFYKLSKDRRKLEKETKAELSYMREFLESKMYDIDNRLMKDPSRWRDTNHLILDSQRNQNININSSEINIINTLFFKNLDINISEIKINRNLVFLLTPFHKEFLPVFEKLTYACSKLGMQVMRGDEEFITGSILKYIIQNILQSRVVVVNLDGRNPNVYYELGITHAIGKPTILITRNLEEVPFDFKDKQLIIYKTLPELEVKLNKALTMLMINE